MTQVEGDGGRARSGRRSALNVKYLDIASINGTSPSRRKTLERFCTIFTGYHTGNIQCPFSGITNASFVCR